MVPYVGGGKHRSINLDHDIAGYITPSSPVCHHHEYSVRIND